MASSLGANKSVGGKGCLGSRYHGQSLATQKKYSIPLKSPWRYFWCLPPQTSRPTPQNHPLSSTFVQCRSLPLPRPRQHAEDNSTHMSCHGGPGNGVHDHHPSSQGDPCTTAARPSRGLGIPPVEWPHAKGPTPALSPSTTSLQQDTFPSGQCCPGPTHPQPSENKGGGERREGGGGALARGGGLGSAPPPPPMVSGLKDQRKIPEKNAEEIVVEG